MIKELLHNCLYFTTNRLTRVITKLAEEEFSAVGLSSSYVFLLLLVIDKPGVSQKELCSALYLTQSTVTRFVDKLEYKGLVSRSAQGKSSLIYPTERGKALEAELWRGWKNIHTRYSEILGEEGELLNKLIDKAGERLEEG